MRFPILLASLSALIPACGSDGGGSNVDAPPVTPPRVISGGGIGDGPIDGVANVYVIDDDTRTPISGATVRVGTLEGMTDADGLFVAEGVTGPQTLAVKAGGHRSEVWVGANGTNMTLNLELSAEATPPSATLSGTVNLSSLTLPAGHIKVASVVYSQTDDMGDPANHIKTLNGTETCNAGLAGTTVCAFSVKVRTGKLALIAAVYDLDTKGTAPTTDDTFTLIRWAARSGITVTGGVDQAGQDLSLIDVGMLNNVTIDFGSPPSGLNTIGAIIGIDAGADGVVQIPSFRTPTDATLLLPRPAVFAGTSYRLTGIASNGQTQNAIESIVLRRGLSGTTLAAGTWLSPPANAIASRTAASWSAVSGATVQNVEYTQGTAKLLNVTAFDGTTQITIPDLITLPSGPIVAGVKAIGAPGLDVNSFALDDVRDKLQMVSSQPVLIN
jgi:hypothetical protein